jgi:hypothetical protein
MLPINDILYYFTISAMIIVWYKFQYNSDTVNTF